MKNVVVPVLLACAALGCGSAPPPKVEEPVQEEAKPRKSGPGPQVAQELGSIDQKKVEQTFKSLLEGSLESCHKQARERVEYLSGDVKVFLRIDGNGKVRYGWFEDTTLGDRQTEKCLLDALGAASWPKPEGGEAEVRNGWGWSGGGEREPTAWSSDKVQAALAEAKDVKKDVDKCRHGIKGDFKVTAYVEHDDSRTDGDKHGAGGGAGTGGGTGKGGKPKGKKGGKDKGGKFKAIGVAPPNKEAAEKVDCIVDALRPLELPSPGSYAAKVTFSL